MILVLITVGLDLCSEARRTEMCFGVDDAVETGQTRTVLGRQERSAMCVTLRLFQSVGASRSDTASLSNIEDARVVL